MGSEGGEDVEERGEGFGAAGGVADGEPGAAVAAEVVAAEDGEAHGETMVAVGFDFDVGRERARRDGEGVFGFDDVLAKFLEFAGHAGDAIGFLFARVGDAGDARGAGEKRGDGGEGEESVGDLAKIFGERGAGRALRGAREKFDEGGIALEALAGRAESGEIERAADDGGQGLEVAGGGGVGLDEVGGLRAVRSGFDVERRVGGWAWNRDAELGHEAEGHLDERPADATDEGNFDGRGGERRDHEERGEELAAFGSVEGDGAAAEAAGVDFEREETLFAGATDVGAEGAKGVDELFHRALAHLRDAIDAVDTVRGDGAEGGEETGGGAGEADEEVDGLGGVAVGLGADADFAGGFVERNFEAERAKRVGHQVRVFAEESAGEGDGLVAEGGEGEGAVGKAFGAGKDDGAAGGAGERLNREDGRERHRESGRGGEARTPRRGVPTGVQGRNWRR